jgi:hypothetical protein
MIVFVLLAAVFKIFFVLGLIGMGVWLPIVIFNLIAESMSSGSGSSNSNKASSPSSEAYVPLYKTNSRSLETYAPPYKTIECRKCGKKCTVESHVSQAGYYCDICT